jgi:hypothetical protein
MTMEESLILTLTGALAVSGDVYESVTVTENAYVPL